MIDIGTMHTSRCCICQYLQGVGWGGMVPACRLAAPPWAILDRPWRGWIIEGQPSTNSPPTGSGQAGRVDAPPAMHSHPLAFICGLFLRGYPGSRRSSVSICVHLWLTVRLDGWKDGWVDEWSDRPGRPSLRSGHSRSFAVPYCQWPVRRTANTWYGLRSRGRDAPPT
jgi:hypothetical protein